MIIPVVMFHSVADDRPDRPPVFPLGHSIATFEAYLRYIRQRGFRTLHLQDVYEHVAGRALAPRRSVSLTFDDAYLDVWTVIAPLLRRYGMKGTVFVPTDFIEPSETCRPTLDDVWAGRTTYARMETFGYLNRAELRALAREGLVEIQSHGRTHTWLPNSDRVVTFHRPGLPLKRHLRWMWWNQHPELKPDWFRRIRHDDLPWGAPVFESDLALAGRAWIPEPALQTRLTDFVAARGGERFFSDSDWHGILTREVESYRAQGGVVARPESEERFRARLHDELAGSRAILESLTGAPVRFFCWPNGGVCEEAYAAAERCGYLATTIPSRLARGGNARGDRPDRIRRIGSTPLVHTKSAWPRALSFALMLERARGHMWTEIPIKMAWLYRRFLPHRWPSEGKI